MLANCVSATLLCKNFPELRPWTPLGGGAHNSPPLLPRPPSHPPPLQKILDPPLKRYGVIKGTDWTFCPPNAPWHNGATEELEKFVKRGINTAIGDHTYSEVQTVLFDVAQLVNQRPIGQHPSNPEDGAYLCSNDLILGRASCNAPQGPLLERFDFMQCIVDALWKNWTRNTTEMVY